jgi:hypothetical protein
VVTIAIGADRLTPMTWLWFSMARAISNRRRDRRPRWPVGYIQQQT